MNYNGSNIAPMPLLKIYQLEGLSKEEILLKYEEILFERENQIRDISSQLGYFNERLFNECEELKKATQRNDQLNSLLFKKNIVIEREEDNQKIMYQKHSILVNEKDQLKKLCRNTFLSIDNNERRRGKSEERKNKMLKNKTLQIHKIKESQAYNDSLNKVNNEKKETDNKNVADVNNSNRTNDIHSKSNELLKKD